MKSVLTLLAAVLVVAAVPPSAHANPLKVYILCGQSNMQGHAQTKTLQHLGMNPATASLLAEIQDPNGEPKVFDDIWISSLGSSEEVRTGKLTTGFGASGRGQVKIGPELAFGITMHKHVGEPILIIKTAWGGKSLHTDFRPPSAGPYVFNDQQKERIEKDGKDFSVIRSDREEATGVYYRLMKDHVESVLADISKVYPNYDQKSGYELAGFVWFQGWNDMVARDVYPNRDQPGGYDQYSKVMADFIRDVRKDLKAPKLPFVIGVMGTGGPLESYGPDRQRYVSTHREFRKAMAAPASMAEFKGNVSAVLTEESWDLQLTELVDRRSQVQNLERKLKKDESVSQQEREAAVRKLTNELLTKEEQQILDVGVSNAEYHYLGSAKILCQIGRSFADALAAMSK